MAAAASQSPAQPIIPIPSFVFNHDVVGILNRIGDDCENPASSFPAYRGDIQAD